MRKKVTIDGKRVYRSHAVWNEGHPDNSVREGEVIHHKDGDKENDNPTNLEKLPDPKHRSLHGEGGRRALLKWKQKHPKLMRKQSRENALSLQRLLKENPEWAKEVAEKRRIGTIAANKRRRLPREERLRRE